jgi:hypothetical protein
MKCNFLYSAVIIMSLFLTLSVKAQICKQFPADCPDIPLLETSEDSIGFINNLHSPQEITMIIKTRRYITSMMEKIAELNGWQMYYLTELAANASVTKQYTFLSYELKPPFRYSISFIFIVNQDSLLAWQNWYNNDLQKASNDAVNSTLQADSDLKLDTKFKKDSDSAQIYGNEMSAYMTKHISEYQAAISANDKKGIEKYEKGLKIIQDKINLSIAKANGEREGVNSNANAKYGDLQTYKHINTVAFRNASIIRVKFNFNYYRLQTSASESAKIVKELHKPGTVMSFLMQNDHTDENEIYANDQFIRSPLLAIILLGSWQTKMDEYKQFHAGFEADKKSVDVETVKRIPCDKIQNLSIHIEGSEKYINRFLLALDIGKLNSILTK